MNGLRGSNHSNYCKVPFFTCRNKRTLRPCLKTGLLHVCERWKPWQQIKALYTIAGFFFFEELVGENSLHRADAMTSLSHSSKIVLICLLHACVLTGFGLFSETFENNELQLEVYEIFLIAAESFVLLFFRSILQAKNKASLRAGAVLPFSF